MKTKTLISLVIAILSIFIIYCYLNNISFTKIKQYLTFFNILKLVLVISIFYCIFQYFNPPIVYKANMIGNKRCMNNISKLQSLNEADLQKIKELTGKCRI